MESTTTTVAKVWGGRIRRRRKQIGLSQAQLADRLGCDQTTVSSWELGHTCPRAADLPSVIEALEATGLGLFDLPEPAASEAAS